MNQCLQQDLWLLCLQLHQLHLEFPALQLHPFVQWHLFVQLHPGILADQIVQQNL